MFLLFPSIHPLLFSTLVLSQKLNPPGPSSTLNCLLSFLPGFEAVLVQQLSSSHSLSGTTVTDNELVLLHHCTQHAADRRLCMCSAMWLPNNQPSGLHIL